MGARILRRRKEKGLTQEALANKLGVSNQAVSKWEGDVCCPDLQLLPLLADTLELSLGALWTRKHGKNRPKSRSGQPDFAHRGRAAVGG